MDSIHFNNPVKSLFGLGRLKDLHEEVLPGKKALAAIGGLSANNDVCLERLERRLNMAGAKHVLFEGVRPNPTRGV